MCIRDRAAAAGADDALAAELEEAASDPSSDPLVVADLLRAAADLSVEPTDRARRLADAVATLLVHGEIRRATASEPEIEHLGPGARRDELLGRLALLSGRLTRARGLLASAHSALARTGRGDGVGAVSYTHLTLPTKA